MSLHNNNEGMSLVELIISMTITAIVLSMIVMIINVASNSFTRTNENVNLQMEAQVAINQISKVVMEASSIELSSTTTAPDLRYLIEGSPCYGIVWKAADKKLYLIEGNPTDTIDDINVILLSDITDAKHLMAEYVQNITITLNNKSANITLDFLLGETDYTISKKVKIRNAN